MARAVLAVVVLSGSLAWAQRPANDDVAAATLISGADGSLTSTNIGATAEPGEPARLGIFPNRSVWWSWTAPFSGFIEFDTSGSGFDTVLAIYTGSSVSTLELVAANDDEESLPPFLYTHSKITFSAEAGTNYLIVVDGFDGEGGSVRLNWKKPVVLFDDFNSSILMEGSKAVGFGYTYFATKEPGEPDHAGEPGGASLWWRWRAPSDGEVLVDVFRSDFRAVLAVYTGDELNHLTPVASAGGRSPGSIGQTTFTVTAGTIYHFAVDGVVWETGQAPETGIAVLRWGPPLPNDNFAAAREIHGFSGSVGGSNWRATPEPGEPPHGFFLGGGSTVWWKWTAPGTGVVFFDTFGSLHERGYTLDTILAVYTGDRLDSLTLVAQNDDAGNRGESLVNFFSEAGTTYWIAVDGSEIDVVWGREETVEGDIVLNWTWWTTIPAEPLRIEEPGFIPGGSFRFFLHGSAGATGVIQRGNGLGAWEDWRPFELDGAALEVIDPDAPTSASRLYRASSR